MHAPNRWILTLVTLVLVLGACTRERPTPEPTATSAFTDASPTAVLALEPDVVPVTPQSAQAAGNNAIPEPSVTPQSAQETFQYTVRPGDTLSTIVEKYDTDMETIRKLNALNSDSLFIGQPLYIPYVEGMTGEGLPTPTPGPFVYTIQEGDTLSGIALRFGAEPIAIIELNNLLVPDNLTVGTEIVIPGYQPAPEEATSPSTDGDVVTVNNGQVVHVVQPGEGLMEISILYGVDATEIADANNLTNRNVLRVGQELIIPGVSLEEALIARGTSHVVQSGESLLGIAVRYGVTVEEILDINGLEDPDSLSVGQELLIPGQ